MIPKEVYEETIMNFLEPCRPYFDDPTVTEVMINGPFSIYIEKKGILYKTEAKFADRESLVTALRNIAQYIGKYISEEKPILEGRLPDGSRVEAILPPAGPDGPHVAIRRFFTETLTVKRLIEFGAMTEDAAAALKAMVCGKLNIVVAGGTGSGKTSNLNALSSFIPDSERVVVIEDNRELQLQRDHVVQLESRPPDHRGRGQVTIRDLFKATLRMRPDRIVVGELRGAEALDLIQAMTSGHGGCLTTIRATYPRDTLTRLETCSMMSDIDMPLIAMRLQIASGIEMLVQVARYRDGSRKLSHITEVLGFDIDSSSYITQDIFVRNYLGLSPTGEVLSELVPTGILPRCLDALHEHGVDLPPAVYAAADRRKYEERHGQQPNGGSAG